MFGGFKLKRNATDAVFSDYVRERAGWKCERCKKEPKHLECSHFYSRANKSTRWDEDNAACLCFKCHQYFTQYPAEHVEWFYKKLGDRKYEELKKRYNSIYKDICMDEKTIRLNLRLKIRELKNKTFGARI